MKRIALVFTFASTLSCLSAQAVEYTQVLPERSTIHFTYQQMGVTVEGRFNRFAGQLSFDPAKPTAAKAAFEVDLASVDTGVPDGDQEVAGKPWFNTRAFPTARFVFGERQGARRQPLRGLGKLTLKGRTQDVVVPATFTAQGNAGVFDGSFTLRRADFSIGEGAWAKFDVVANEVQVRFRITANSK
jgi:polyisoprenoid-binding protein YceI